MAAITGALLGAAIGAGGSLISANSAKKAASQQAAASQAATDTATRESARQFDQSRTDQLPWLQVGQGALQQLARTYGINVPQSTWTGGTPAQSATARPFTPTAYTGGPLGQLVHNANQARDKAAWDAAEAARVAALQQTPQGQPQTAPAAPTGPYGDFLASPDYQFRQDEQMRALTARNAALGIQDSGAAQRSAIRLSGNLASGEFNNWANHLSALAGVGQTAAQNMGAMGQNYANTVGNFALNNAANLSSSYGAQAQAQQGLYQGLAGIGTGLIKSFWPVT